MSTRHRTKGTPYYLRDALPDNYINVVQERKYYHAVTGALIDHTPPHVYLSANAPELVGEGEEVMDDDISKGRHNKSLRHSKVLKDRPGINQSKTVVLDYISHIRVISYDVNLPKGHGVGDSLPTVPSHDHVLGSRFDPCMEALVSRHNGKLRSPMNESFSIANFLYELKDLKSFSKVAERWRTFRREKQDRLGDLPNELYNDVLMHEYGLEPLIADLKDIAGIFDSFMKNYHYLMYPSSRRSKIVTDMNFPAEQFGGHVYIPPIKGAVAPTRNHFKIVQEPQDSMCRMKIVSQIVPNTHPITKMRASIVSAFSSLGLFNPARISWNMIPFSFVVDYICNVDDWLKDVGDFTPHFAKYRFKGHSFGVELQDSARSIMYYAPDAPAFATLLTPGICAVYDGLMEYGTRKTYFRFGDLPYVQRRFFTCPSFRELALMGILSRQVLRKDGSIDPVIYRD